MKRSWLVFSTFLFLFFLSLPGLVRSTEDRSFLVKLGVMESASPTKDRLNETKIVTMDPSRRPGWCFLVDPPNEKPYEIYSIHYLPKEPTRLTGNFKNAPLGNAITGIKTPVRRVEGIRPFCFDFDHGDPLGTYRFKVFINGVLNNFLNMEVVARQGQAESDFIIESKFRRTFAPSKPLKVGQKVGFELATHSELANYHETFYVQKCGLKCNTAKQIARWKMTDLEQKKRMVLTISEDGEYYFWLKKVNKEDETGPVEIVKIDIEGLKHLVTFESGTKLKIWNVPLN